MTKLFSFLKGLAIVRWGAIALKQLWPFLLLFLFWPEINAMMESHFDWWATYISGISQYIVDASNVMRDIPIVGKILEFIDESWQSIRARIITTI